MGSDIDSNNHTVRISLRLKEFQCNGSPGNLVFRFSKKVFSKTFLPAKLKGRCTFPMVPKLVFFTRHLVC